MQAAAKRKQRDRALALRIKEAYLSDDESGLVSARGCLLRLDSDGPMARAQPGPDLPICGLPQHGSYIIPI